MTLTRLLLVTGLALILIGWAVLLPQRPSPSGPHAIGRAELTLRAPDGQLIPTTVWYPTNGLGGAAPVENAPVDARIPAPLILYSPGWGANRSQSSIQLENLASHGFVVVGCDDYASDPAADPDRGVALDLSSDAAMADTIERGGRHVLTQARRLLAALRALEAGQSTLLAGRVDLARVGVLGYSVGGAAALQAALIDTRIVAVINVDGALFGPPATQLGSEAYLLVSSQEAFPSDADLASPDPWSRNYALLSAQDLPRNRRRMERSANYWILLKHADHADLSDTLFTFSRGKMFRTNFERRGMNAAIEAYEVAFFRSALSGDHGPLLRLLGQDNQDMRLISPTAGSAAAANLQE